LITRDALGGLAFQNGDFELGSNGEPESWTPDMWNPGLNSIFQWDSAYGVNGTGGVMIQNAVPNDSRYIQSVTLVPGSQYRVTAMLKLESYAWDESNAYECGASISSVIEFSDHSSCINEATPGKWQSAEMIFTAESASATIGCRLGYYSSIVSGTLYCDDFKIELLGGENNGSDPTDSSTVTNPANNLAFCRETTQTSTELEGYSLSSKAVDGITDHSYITHYGQETSGSEYGAWWEVNLCAECCIQQVTVYNRFDAHCPDQPPTYSCGPRLNRVTVQILDAMENIVDSDQHDPNTIDLATIPVWSTKQFNANGNRVRLQLPTGSRSLHVAEVVVVPCEGTTCPCEESCSTLSTGNCAGFTCSEGDGGDGSTENPDPSAPPMDDETDMTGDNGASESEGDGDDVATENPDPSAPPVDDETDMTGDNGASENGGDSSTTAADSIYCDSSTLFYDGINCNLAKCAERNGCDMQCFEEKVWDDCCGAEALEENSPFCGTNQKSCQAARNCCAACLMEAEMSMRSEVLDLCRFDCGGSKAPPRRVLTLPFVLTVTLAGAVIHFLLV